MTSDSPHFFSASYSPSDSGRTSESFLFLGRIGRPRGLDGSFFVYDRADALPNLKIVYVKNKRGEMQAFTCLRGYMAGGKPALRLAEIGNRDAAELWRDHELFMRLQDLSINPSKEYLWQALLGREVLDDAGQLLGKVKRLENHQAHDVLVIEEAGRCCDIPMVAAYVDMSFDPLKTDEALHLLVSRVCFEEFWYEES